MFLALPELTVEVTPAGLYLRSSNDGIQQRTTADDKRYAALANQMETLGMAALRKVKTYLYDHGNAFAEYSYTNPHSQVPSPDIYLPHNSGKRSFIV